MQPADRAQRGPRRARRHRPPAASAERFTAEALPHMGQLYSAALRMTGEERGAQDLVIETYARAYAALGQHDGAGITAWLYRNMASAVEDNGLADGGSAGQVRQRHEPPPRLDETPGGTVKDSLQRVPARSRFAIYLADVEGFSSPAIARIMQQPVSTVISRLYRGRRQLRAALEARA